MFSVLLQLSAAAVPQPVPPAGLHLRLRLRLEHAQVRRYPPRRCRERAPRRQGAQTPSAPTCACLGYAGWSGFVRGCDRRHQFDAHSDGDGGEGINATDGTARCAVRRRPTSSREPILKMSEKKLSQNIFSLLKPVSDLDDVSNLVIS